MRFFPVLAALLLAALPARADEAPVLRAMSWNIHHGEGADGKVDLERIATVIKAQQPDVVFLQEVDNKCKRSGGIDQASEIARLTGLQHVFGKAMDHQGGEYGQAILAKFPLSDVKIHRLPGDGEPRIAVSAKGDTPLGPVTLASIHLDFKNEEQQLAQAQVAAAALLQSEHPIFLAGDFNAKPDSKTLAVFAQAPWVTVTKQSPSATHPADKPTDEIDYTVVRGLKASKPTTVIAETTASDHRPLVAVVAKPE